MGDSQSEGTSKRTIKRQAIEFFRPIAWLRYLIIRTVAVPIPFFTHRIPIIGGKTAIELAIMVAIALLALTAAGSGNISDIMSGLLVLLAMRYNVLTFVFGIPFERALLWHKGCALVAMGCIGIHMAHKGNNGSGIALICLMSIACGAYLIKPFLFEVFYYAHIICYVITVPYALSHGCSIFPYAVIFWASDVVLRYIITQHWISMHAEILAGDVVRLSFPKKFEYEPGQYVFLMLPGLNPIEYHPFSLSSSWEEDTTTIHIRALGDWSKRLYGKVKRLQEEHGNAPQPLKVFVEGPYGAPSVDHESSDYKVWLLVSGGIGITPLQSMYNHFVHQVESGNRPDMRKVIFVWSVKDKATAEAIEEDRRKAGYLPLSFQPSMVPAATIRLKRAVPGLTNDRRELVNHDILESGAAAATATATAADANTTNNVMHTTSTTTTTTSITTDKQQQLRRARDSANEDGFELKTDLIFHAEYYLTQVRSEEQFAAAGIDPVEQKHLHFGRPDLCKLFERTRELCLAEGIKRVGVMTCGPKSMVDDIMDLCQQSQLSPDCATVRFDGHSEVFNF